MDMIDIAALHSLISEGVYTLDGTFGFASA
jgi:hypothetical protein